MLLFLNKFREMSLRLVITSAKETCCWAGRGLQESWRIWISRGRFMWILFFLRFSEPDNSGDCPFLFWLFFLCSADERFARKEYNLPSWPPSSEGRQRVPDGHGAIRPLCSSHMDEEKGHWDRAGSWWITEKMQEGSLKLKAASAISTNCRYPS